MEGYESNIFNRFNNSKILRIKQIESNGGITIVSEGISANYMDIINYSIFSIIHLKNK